MKSSEWRTFSADFETTVDAQTKLQTKTEVWSAASVELGTEDVKVFHSIDDLYSYYCSLDENLVAYFHNLKFDGNFWLYFLMNKLHYKQAFICTDEITGQGAWMDEKRMPPESFQYVISDMGQWYTITIRMPNKKFLILKDSLKLMPFTLKAIGKSFKTKHQKLEMEYKGKRYAGCPISTEELEYIKNDVLVLKEALEFMFNEGHNRLTIGSCCLAEFKKPFEKQEYNAMFPDLYQRELDAEIFGSSTVGDWIHNSYKGGWCYLVKGKECKVYKNGVTADVNSLYPSMMHSESGNYYPIGKPRAIVGGEELPDEARYNPFWYQPTFSNNECDDCYYFFRIRTRFRIKPGFLPFVQIKNTMLYKATEALETSDVMDKNGVYYSEYVDKDGNLHDTRVTLTLTQTDLVLLREHYDLYDYELLDYIVFNAEIGIFDEYIDHYAEIKKHSKGAMRTEAKLFLNNLYGKMASSPNSSFKVAQMKGDNTIGFYDVEANDKQPGYIPIGSAITSYARNFTIRAAQKNYYGPDKPGFIYADTDSIHCDLKPEDVKGITVHPVNFCCWKLESSWDFGWFVRQKTYIEHVVAEDLEPIEESYYNIKCAGMPKKCKDLFELSFDPETKQRIDDGKPDEKWTPEEIKFLSKTRTFKDFKRGLTIPGKLLPKRIEGGVLLVDTDFTMR